MITTTILFYGILFLLGLVFGSFGSVLSSRLADFSFSDILGDHTDIRNKKRKKTIKTIIRGHSKCPNCQHTLYAKDLIPIVSYVTTKGRCRYCKQKISSLYIWREIGCGMLFMIIGGVVLGHTPSITISIFTIWLLLIRVSYLLLVHDIETMFLHEPLWILLLFLSILFVGYLPNSFFAGYTLGAPGGRYYAILWSIIFLIFFFGFYRFARGYVRIRMGYSGEGFGSGDVRIAPLLGVQFGAREYFLQVQSIVGGEGFSWTIAIQHFSYYVILAGILCLLYAGLQKLIKPTKSIRHLPFFTGMITAIWVIIVVTFFGIL